MTRITKAEWCEICNVGKPEHKCLCGECDKIHLICQKCYEFGKDEGMIIDKGFRMKQYSTGIKKKFK
jgi:hypothetical protein